MWPFKRKNQQPDDSLGTLELSDTGVTYTRGGQQKHIDWNDIASVAYAESLFGTFGEDRWILRSRPETVPPVDIPDYSDLTEPLLEWCSRKLDGFDVDVYHKASRDGVFKNYQDREPILLECWRRSDAEQAFTASTSALAALGGAKLMQIWRAVHPEPYQEPEHFGPVELRMDSGTCLVLDIEPDGQSVCFRLEPLVFEPPSDDSVVRERVEVDVGEILGKAVSRIDALVEHGYVAAWRVWFGERYICYANIGDNAQFLIAESPEFPEGSWRTIFEERPKAD